MRVNQRFKASPIEIEGKRTIRRGLQIVVVVGGGRLTIRVKELDRALIARPQCRPNFPTHLVHNPR